MRISDWSSDVCSSDLIDSAIAGGVDTTSDAPIGVNEGLRRILLQANRAKTTAEKIKTFLQLRPHHLVPELPRNGEPRTGLSMGQPCELMAQTWQIPREEQDQLASSGERRVGKEGVSTGRTRGSPTQSK